MKRHSIAWMTGLLFLLALCGVHSVYHLTNFLCLARAEPAYRQLWLNRIYLWCGVSMTLGVIWVALLILIVRRGRLADDRSRLP
jgi:uncharacterized membrane protein